jgi:hypothetical protein
LPLGYTYMATRCEISSFSARPTREPRDPPPHDWTSALLVTTAFDTSVNLPDQEAVD